ncbi:MAG: hypothetical protein V4733_12220 [Verrucomicrobiota bacterium]
MRDAEPELPPPRRSASADSALRSEIKRVRRMTIEERVKAALSMGEKFAWLSSASKPK